MAMCKVVTLLKYWYESTRKTAFIVEYFCKNVFPKNRPPFEWPSTCKSTQTTRMKFTFFICERLWNVINETKLLEQGCPASPKVIALT